jgi:hypothetical protein
LEPEDWKLVEIGNREKHSWTQNTGGSLQKLKTRQHWGNQNINYLLFNWGANILFFENPFWRLNEGCTTPSHHPHPSSLVSSINNTSLVKGVVTTNL